ncbi:MAG: GAF domain-containing protein [Bacteroidetes bacterium]|jgi:signal transduction histidine kinase|nr:GAF domain-containing protein [Bacteroidota bacterium]
MTEQCNETHERERIRALESFKVLDSPPEEEFDNLTRLAAEIAGTPVSAVNLIDENRQWTKSMRGLDPSLKAMPREQSVCHYTVKNKEITEIPDLESDDRFAEFDYVKQKDGLHYYLGIPLITKDNYAIGSLCVMDYDKRDLSRQQVDQLKIIAKQVMINLELHKQNHELKELNDYKVRLMKMLSHDMRSPLNGIIGLSGMLKEMNISNNEEHLELLDIIEQSSTQLNQMIDEVMSYTIIESDGLTLEKKETLLSETVRDISKLYKPAARIKNITLDFYTENLDEPVHIDADKFEQIFGNLLSNAIKYTRSGGEVHTAIIRKNRRNSDYIELTVTDSGIGMNEKEIEELLSKERKTPVSKGTSGEKSSGIGLTIVHHFVELFSGEITIESEPGEGTRFTVQIPL